MNPAWLGPLNSVSVVIADASTVVRELVENALDAGAKTITVQIDKVRVPHACVFCFFCRAAIGFVWLLPLFQRKHIAEYFVYQQKPNCRCGIDFQACEFQSNRFFF